MNLGRPIWQRQERLAFLTEAPVEWLAAQAQPCHFAAGDSVCLGPQLHEAAYFLLSGGCELVRSLPDGSVEVLQGFGPGTAFGDWEDVHPEAAGLSVVATADSVLLRFERELLESLRKQIQHQRSNGGHSQPTDTRILQFKPNPPSSARQIVTLAYLSNRLPAPLVSERLARSLCEVTQAAVVLVRFVRQAGGSSKAELNGEFHMPARLAKTAAAFHSLVLDLSQQTPSPNGIASLLSQLSRRFRHVLLEVPAMERSAPWLLECLGRSDLAYLLLQPKVEEVYHAAQVMRGVRGRCRNGGAHVKPVVCLAEGETINAFDQLLQRVAAPVEMYVRGCPVLGAGDSGARPSPTGSFRADLRRLAREIGGRLVGLALSSGAAKGFAHIGVIQVLEENGIEVDVVAGASMGAYVGSLWAHGNDGMALEKLARELEGRWAVWSLVDPVFPPRQGFMRGLAVKKRLMRSLGNAGFADLARPLRVVASNLETLERVVFSSGEVATAVHASLAVPGVCVPVTIDGETYIDGGIVDPLPADVLREMGVSRVIAVDVIPTPDRNRSQRDAQRERARQPDRSAGKLRSLERQVNYFARGNLFEILMRSLYGAQIRVAEAARRHADVVLHPNISDNRWLDFRHPGKFIALGREEAERHLDEIKSLVSTAEPNHEQHPASQAMGTVA